MSYIIPSYAVFDFQPNPFLFKTPPPTIVLSNTSKKALLELKSSHYVILLKLKQLDLLVGEKAIYIKQAKDKTQIMTLLNQINSYLVNRKREKK